MIQDKKCIWCGNKRHKYKDCRKWYAKQRVVTAARGLSVRRESKSKQLNEDKSKEWLQFKTTKPEPTDFSKVPVKANRHPALALVDLHTQVDDLIDSKLIHLYHLLTRLSEKKILTTAIKRFQERMDKECIIQLDWIGRTHLLCRTPFRMGHKPWIASSECHKHTDVRIQGTPSYTATQYATLSTNRVSKTKNPSQLLSSCY